jgi:hypothetical protein
VHRAGAREDSELRPFSFAVASQSARRSCLVVLICAALFCVSSTNAQQGQPQPLTNSAVIRLVRAGFKEKTVIAIIRTRASRFDLAPDRLIDLKKNGVSENVILAMIEHQDASENFAFDDSFDDMNTPGLQKGSASPGGVDIFGSGGNSSSRTRGRGQSGANQDNRVTSGSVTARIVRPPLEEGGAPKLERTPTLTNDSIVGMVEAGFSEGTIIRRIEQSPADFDLTAPKLADLRKRRVTEPVIDAMRAAMSDDATSGGPPKLKNPEQ